MAYARKDYLGTRCDTTLNGSINDSTTSITITSATGWPSVANTGFYAVIDPDSATEEKVFVTARSGTGLTATRGVDGSTAQAHSSGATIRPCLTAVDFDEANYMVAQTVGKATTAGQLLKASAANTFAALDKGSNSTVLAVDSGGTLAYTTAASAMFADSAVSNAKLAAMTRGTIKAGDSSGAVSDLALGTSGQYLVSDGTDAAWTTPASTGWTTVRKSSNQVYTVGVGAYDSDLSFGTTLGSVYVVEFGVIVTITNDAASLLLGETGLGSSYGPGSMAGPIIDELSAVAIEAADTWQGATPDFEASGTKRLYVWRGTHTRQANAGGNNTFKMYWSPNATTALTVHAGSYLRYRALT